MIQIKYDDKTEAYLTHEAREALGSYFGKFNTLFKRTGFQSLCELANEVCEREEGQRWTYLVNLLDRMGVIKREEKIGMATDLFSAINDLPEESYGAIKLSDNVPAIQQGKINRGRKVVEIFPFT